jgi:hypothetical protein
MSMAPSLPENVISALKEIVAQEHRLSHPKGAKAEKLKEFASGQRSGYAAALIDLGYEAAVMRALRDELGRLKGVRVTVTTDKDLKQVVRRMERMKQRIIVPGNRYFPDRG